MAYSTSITQLFRKAPPSRFLYVDVSIMYIRSESMMGHKRLASQNEIVDLYYWSINIHARLINI